MRKFLDSPTDRLGGAALLLVVAAAVGWGSGALRPEDEPADSSDRTELRKTLNDGADKLTAAITALDAVKDRCAPRAADVPPVPSGAAPIPPGALTEELREAKKVRRQLNTLLRRSERALSQVRIATNAIHHSLSGSKHARKYYDSTEADLRRAHDVCAADGDIDAQSARQVRAAMRSAHSYKRRYDDAAEQLVGADS